MVYNLDVTKKHPLAEQFASNLNDMVKTDGGKGVFPDDVIAISLDNAERAERRTAPRKTMDSALGLVARRPPGRKVNEKMLMCEFRFNYKNWRNISKSELEDKVKNSKMLLQRNYTGQIESKCFFIFDEKIYEQAKNYFARIYMSKTKKRVVTTEREFQILFF